LIFVLFANQINHLAMKQKLLTLALFLIAVVATAQVQAFQVPDMVQCNVEVFDLTVQTPIVLGGQNPNDHTVTFHQSFADAQSGTQAITDPTFFVVNGMQQIVYIRVTKLSDSTYATTSFMVKWDQSYYEIDTQYACNSYTFPALTNITYYTQPNGGGVQIPAGTVLTNSQMIYFVHDNQMGCVGYGNFMVNIGSVEANQPSPFTLCEDLGDGMAIFNLTSKNAEITTQIDAGISYFTTLQNATANVNAISNPTSYTSESTVVFARVTLGDCFEIVPLELNVISIMPVADVSACTSYTLPALVTGEYHTAPNGAGTMLSAGDVITSSMTVYVYYPQCFGGTSFVVTITQGGPEIGIENVYACESYTLPEVAGVTYYDLNQQVVPAGTVITQSMPFTVVGATVGNCENIGTLVVNIATSLQNVLTLTGCDPNNNGIATFDFSHLSFINGMFTMYASEADAMALQNPLSSPYTNTAGLEHLYARYTFNGQLCNVVAEIGLETQSITTQTPQTVTACDPDNDGVAAFDLTPLIQTLWENNPAEVTFHETMVDAEFGALPIQNTQQYYNIVPFSHVIYARLEVSFMDCFKVIPVTLQTDPGCTPNSIAGVVRYDSDNNGCSVSDVPAQNISVYNYVGNTIYQTFTNADGNYSFEGTPNGANVVVVTDTQFGATVTPTAHNVQLPGNVTDKDFCLSVPNPVQDVAVYLMPVTQARPGFPASYSLVYANVGTLSASGVVTVYFPSAKVTYMSSYPAMTLSGNSLSISYTNLLPFQSSYHYITFEVQPPQIVPLGDILTYAATITPATDNDSSNNASAFSQEVVNSYDPNDISVLEGETITEVQADGYLHYTIRFQNIGNADAIRVRIENPLDANLDFNTIQPLGASHDYHLQRKNGHLTFIFNDIYLPGSQYDEPGSHGFVTYRIKPKTTVGIGDSMSNNASIYFDFNDPIVTNTVTTTVQLPAGTADFAANSFSMYPNPANGLVTLKLNEMDAADVVVTDVLGKTVLTPKMTQQEQSFDIAALTSGIYFVKVTAEGQSITKKLIVK